MADAVEGRRLVGRSAELDIVDRSLRALLIGRPSVLVCVGEAGIGKSALVAEAVSRAERLGISAGVGHCLDVSAHLPCGPVLEAMRDIGTTDAARAPSVAANPDGVLMALASMAASKPLVLAVEDVHWAEASTRDVLRMLAHGGQSPVMLLVTVRDEAVGSAATTRELVVDLTRGPTATRVNLGAIAPEDLTALALGIRGETELTPEVVGCVERAEGNPLHLEALLDALGSDESVPSPLSELFLVQLGRLSRESAEAVRAASVVGTRFDIELVAAAASVDVERAVQMLREAAAHRLVVEREGALEFRHALVRDALYDDLLPAERRALHSRVAQVLTGRVDAEPRSADISVLGQLAHHAEQAGDTEAALAASTRAGLRWRLDGTDALQHLLEAGRLWHLVRSPEQVAGMTHTDLMDETAQVLWTAGEPDDARRVVRAALAEAEGEGDTAAQSRLWATCAFVGKTAPDDDFWEHALRRCLELAGPSPSRERARAHHINGLANVFQKGRLREGIRHFEKAVVEARAAGLRDTEGSALWFLGSTGLDCGNPAEGIASLRRGVAIMHAADNEHRSLLARGDLVWALAGWTTDPGTVGEAHATAAAARAAGLAEPLQHALGHVSYVHVWRGELGAAAEALDEMRTLGIPDSEWHWTAAHLLLAQGRLAEAEAELRVSADVETDIRFPDEDTAALWLELYLARGDVRRARRYLEGYVRSIGDTESVERHTVTASYGHLVTRSSRSTGSSVDPLTESADNALARLLGAGAASWPACRFRSRVLAARACAARRAGRPSETLWEEAIADLDAAGYRLLRLRLVPWYVEDLWASGSRDKAVVVAQAAWDEARALGTDAVAEHIRRVAVSCRMSLPEQRLDRVRAKLTAREREVMDLLEDGATNRQIAEALVISEKTAAVHVSHVLAKLGASRRGEAVAMARQASEEV